jgi:hypothetical protein
VAAAVVAPGRAGVGVAESVLHVLQCRTQTQGLGGIGVAQAMASDAGREPSCAAQQRCLAALARHLEHSVAVVVAESRTSAPSASEIRSPQKVSRHTSAAERGECAAAAVSRRRSSSAVRPMAWDSSETLGRRTEATGEW